MMYDEKPDTSLLMSASTTRSTLPSGPRAEVTRSNIVETAERLFRGMGYQKTTVADIARELKMSPANIYRFFPSKAAVNEAICARILGELDALAWSVARGPGTPADRLRLLFRTMQKQTIALFFNEKRMHDMVAAALEEHWSVIDDHIRTIETAIRHIVMDGQADGSFARLDADEAAQTIHATMVGFSHPAVVQQCAATMDLPAIAESLAEFCLRALRPDD
jgi:AcrR family transcriptional regulator